MKSFANIAALLIGAVITYACAATPQEEIPLSVDHVETHRVADSLVRIILHNTELLPQISVELIQTPEVKLLQKRMVDSITVDNEKLIFKNSTGVFIDNVALDNGVVNFSVEYYFSHGRPFLTAHCQIDANNNTLSTLTCQKTKQE
jgi:hypothetical protein